jgi:putative membrane protein insertion efficiency factor
MRRIIIFFIRGYQKLISPILPPSCRFYPTCSEYAIQAVEKHGVIVGSIKSMWRILRCNPLNKGGYDPIE